MKIAILGATGGCGQELARQALERGHEVRAVVRSSSWQPPAGAAVLRGDLLSEPFLREAVRGQDAVLSALGQRLPSIAPWARPELPDLLARNAAALVAAMRGEGVRRLLAISAGGVGDSRGKVPAFFRAFIAASALRHAYADLEVMERALLGSGLDVCICRPTGLTDGPRTGQARVCDAIAGRATISRADVAAWMLDELQQPRYGGQTPMITVTGAA